MDEGFPVEEGYNPFRGYKTWCRIVGEKEESGKVPLICLHGGPGATHDYFQRLTRFIQLGGV